jgi:hypothetical protein
MKIGRGNRSTRRKPAPAPLCPPQIPLDQNRDRTRASAMGSRRLTACLMSQPYYCYYLLGAESLLRSRQLLSYSRKYRQFTEPEGSIPSSQEPATGLYPKTDETIPVFSPICLSRVASPLITLITFGETARSNVIYLPLTITTQPPMPPGSSLPGNKATGA